MSMPRVPPSPPTPTSLLASSGREMLLKCAEMAASVYHEDPSEHYLGKWNFNLISTAPTQVALCISPDGDAAAIVFPGSVERGDWYDNADVRRTSMWVAHYDGNEPRTVTLHMHMGFLRQWKRVEAEVTDFAMHSIPPDCKLYIIGHSLGAALASIAHVAISARNKWSGRGVTLETVCFNGPRVFTKDASLWIEKHLPKVTRVVTSHGGILDLVPRVPKESWGFRHFGELHIFDELGCYSGWGAAEAWQAMRKANPVGLLPAWRILSRIGRGVLAHRWWTVIDLIRLNHR